MGQRVSIAAAFPTTAVDDTPTAASVCQRQGSPKSGKRLEKSSTLPFIGSFFPSGMLFRRKYGPLFEIVEGVVVPMFVCGMAVSPNLAVEVSQAERALIRPAAHLLACCF